MNSQQFGRVLRYRTSLSARECRVVNHLAQGLCGVMQIRPEGCELIALLGLGSEGSNLQALETWILVQLSERDLALGPETFDWLRDRLTSMALSAVECGA